MPRSSRPASSGGRAGATALLAGSLLAVTGMDRLGLTGQGHETIFGPISLVGIFLNGLGWILLGGDLALRGGGRRPAQRHAEGSTRLEA